MRQEYKVVVEDNPNLPFDDEYGAGRYVQETWTLDGVIHRQYGPAVTIIHPATGLPLQQEFYENGLRHNLVGPAVVKLDHPHGKVISEQFFERGRRVIPQGPTPAPGLT